MGVGPSLALTPASPRGGTFLCGAALTKEHRQRLKGLFDHGSGGPKSKIKVSAESQSRQGLHERDLPVIAPSGHPGHLQASSASSENLCASSFEDSLVLHSPPTSRLISTKTLIQTCKDPTPSKTIFRHLGQGLGQYYLIPYKQLLGHGAWWSPW